MTHHNFKSKIIINCYFILMSCLYKCEDSNSLRSPRATIVIRIPYYKFYDIRDIVSRSYKTSTEFLQIMVRLVEDEPRPLGSELVRQFTWHTDSGCSITAITYGAVILSINVPDKNGDIADVALGFDDLELYETKYWTNMGAMVGRVINIIKNATFELDGKTYHLAKNRGIHNQHGGFECFGKKNFKATVDGTKLILSYLSTDGEEGFPGDLITSVIYEVTEDMTLQIEFIATTSKKTIVNLGHHVYLNLAGHGSGAAGLYDHVALINSDRITDTDEDYVPTGEFIEVGGTPYDLRTPKRLGDIIINAGSRYHHNFCVANYDKKTLNFVARVNHPQSGRYVEVKSNQPGVQFYTSYYMPEIPGKGGVNYGRHAGFCLETQNYPDAINHPHFPSPVLKPGEVYRHKVQYKFGVSKGL